MAGDVPADERALVEPAGTDIDIPNPMLFTRHSTVEGDPGVPAPNGERLVHRYGRVAVLGRAGTPPSPAPPPEQGVSPEQAVSPRPLRTVEADPAATGTADATGTPDGAGTPHEAGTADGGGTDALDLVESLGLAAFRLRNTAGYVRAKLDRDRADEPWNMGRNCTDVAPPRGASTATEQTTPDAGGPTSSYFEGSVAVGLVLVEGPTPALQFTAAERTKIVAEVQNGLSWHATSNPAADLTFSYDIQIVRLTQSPNPSAADLEAHWRNPAMARLGYQANFDGVYQYVDGLRARLGTRWAYCAFFTSYPLRYFAYAAIGGPRLVMTYDNDGWGPDNIDRVFAHESSHIFGAVDEYASSGCGCGGRWGRFGIPNGNCDTCSPTSEPCLMLANTFQYCRYTPAHVGWGRGVGGNPVLIQSSFGRAGNFEVVVPSAFAGLTHISRDNDAAGYPWREPVQTGHASGRFGGVSMVQSRLSSPGAFEVVACVGRDLLFLWRDGTVTGWHEPVRLVRGVDGVPSLVQSRLGVQGNFELVVPAADVGILHMWRNNDVQGFPWSATRLFAANLGHVDAVSMVHGTLGGGAGVLEAVARVGSRLVHLWRGHDAAWRTTVVFADGVAGNPVLIQSTFGSARNFEVVVPSAGVGLVHFWRNNSVAGTPWSGPRPFAAELGRVDAVSMIQSNFGGHLEVVARVGGRLYFLWRNSGAGATWSRPNRIF
jgi:hypothetical protein